MILFLDLVGGPFDGNTPHEGTLGGSELAQIQLAEALAARGKTVHVINRKHINGTPPVDINGVRYGGSVDTRDVRTCILSRMTPLPAAIPSSAKVIVSLTDQGPHDIAPCHLVVGVSQWQVNRFASVAPGVPCKVIPPIVEVPKAEKKVPGRYIYAGAAMKGLDETLDGWDDAKRPGTLEVCHGGWGRADESQQARMKFLGVQYLGDLSPADLRKRVARASYLLGAKMYPETFCAVAAIAEASGTVPILYSPHGRTGLDEAIATPVFYDRDAWLANIREPNNPVLQQNNFSPSRIARLWEKVL